MALLNKDEIMYYGPDGPTLRLGSALFLFYNTDDNDYWYVDFNHGPHLVDVKLFMPIDIMEKIRNGEVILILNNSHEAFHDPVEYIYQYFVEELKFPPKQIRLLSESATIGDEIQRVAKKYNSDTIHADWLRIFEYNVSRSLYNLDYRKLNTLAIKDYDKKFLNLNRRWRKHRPMLVGLLHLNNLLDQGYVSFANNVDGENWDGIWSFIDHYAKDIKGTELYTLLTENKDILESIPTSYLDTPKLHINQVQVDNGLDYFYENSYFSIVNETNYFKEMGEGIFLSEKVFKPVLKMHPFILASRPYSMRKFSELGYKTFSPYIDESYDIEEDDSKRLLMIVEETKRLCNLTKDELERFLIGCKDICEYNYQILAEKKFDQKSYITPLI
jgi:hypothetical protein